MKIYHNSNCSKSCGVLNIIQQQGYQPQVIEYLNQTPDKNELLQILTMLGLKPFDIIRKNEPIFIKNFEGQVLTDAQWLEVLISNPILIERPIVVINGKAIIARPIEKIFELL